MQKWMMTCGRRQLAGGWTLSWALLEVWPSLSGLWGGVCCGSQGSTDSVWLLGVGQWSSILMVFWKVWIEFREEEATLWNGSSLEESQRSILGSVRRAGQYPSIHSVAVDLQQKGGRGLYYEAATFEYISKFDSVHLASMTNPGSG